VQPNIRSHRSLQSIFIILLSSILCALLFCVDFDSNPIASDYKGDYGITVDFGSLPDTLSVFESYTLSWNSTGVDSFYRVTIGCSSEGALLPTDERIPSPIPLYFTRPFTGTVRVTGIQPNGEKDEHNTDSIMVINPYRIAVDSSTLFTSDTVSFRIVTIPARSSGPHRLSCRWVRDGIADTLPADEPFSIVPVRTDTVTIAAALIDSLGNRVDIPVYTFVVPLMKHPGVSIAESLLVVPAGVPATIVAAATNADSLHWSVLSLDFDTITAAASLSFVWPDTGSDTVIVTARNRFGFEGSGDTIVIHIEQKEFELALLSFPTTASVKVKSTWKVEARKDGERMDDSLVDYHWEVAPESAADSMSISGGSLVIRPSEQVRFFIVTVTANIGSDTLFPRTATVLVTAYRPVLTLLAAPNATGVGDSIRFVVRTFDSNPDGSVDAVYCRIASDEDAVEIDEDTFTVAFSEAGVRTLSFWCVDNDGLVSDTVSTRLTVSSQFPWFIESRFDTSVYINDSIRITAEAVSGNTGGTVSSWLWDLDHDDDWDTVTLDNYIDATFSVAETAVIVTACVDNRGDTSAAFRTARIAVLAGEPRIVQTFLPTRIIHEGDTVRVRIRARDPDGTVDSLLIATDTSSWQAFAVKPGAQIDTTLPVRFGETGTVYLTTVAVDNNGLHSSYCRTADSIVVESGKPVVTALLPDTCWMYDTVRYTVSAYDPNGTVKSIAIQWERNGTWKSNTDSLFSHLFTTAGEHTVRITATDNSGETGDTTIERVFVRKGAPTVSLQTDYDTAWIFDDVVFHVTGSDTNGTVKKQGILWDDPSSEAEIRSDGIFTHSFSPTGLHTIHAFTIDDDGISSDTVEVMLYIKNSSPVIASVRTVPAAASLFINDTVSFIVKATDANGTFDSLFVYRDADLSTLPVILPARDDSAVFPTTVPVAGSGGHSFLFRVKDDDAMITDTVITVLFRTGTPLVTAASCEASPIWVRDENRYRVSAADTNGYIRKILVSWDGDDHPDDSLTVSRTASSIDTFFNHAWDTTGGGKTVLFWTSDDDGLLSSAYTTVFNIHKGTPVISGNAGDTILVVVGQPGGTYRLTTQASDSNGTIVRYYWDERETFDSTTLTADRKTPDPWFDRVVGTNDVDRSWFIWIYALDDDGFMRGGQYLIYADGAPVAPTLTAPEADAFFSSAGDPVPLEWTGFDHHDGTATEYAIMLKPSGPDTPEDTLHGFMPATSYTLENDVVGFTFTPETQGIYTWRVIARDMHGLVTTSATRQFSHPGQ